MSPFIQPLPQHTLDYIAEVNGIRIRICLTTENILQYVLPPNTYWPASQEETGQAEYTLSMILSDIVPEQFVFHKDRLTEVEVIKTEENCPNRRYSLGDTAISVFQYPNHSIHIETNNWKSITILAGDKSVLIFYLKEYIKRIVAESINLLSIHASAIARNYGAVLFVGHGNSGKSTIAYNLSLLGWSILHDDLVFVEKHENVPCATGIHINPCLRKNALPYVIGGDMVVLKRKVFENTYHKCYYLCDVDIVKEPIPIKAIVLLTQGDLAENGPLSVTGDTNGLLQPYISEPSYIELLDNIPVYRINRSNPVKQINCFLEKLVDAEKNVHRKEERYENTIYKRHPQILL